MNSQILFSSKNKKKISPVCRLLNLQNSMLGVNISHVVGIIEK